MAEYVPERYPGWRYHASGATTLIYNEEDDAALGPMWFDSPVTAAQATDRGPVMPVASTEPPRRKRGRPRRRPVPVAEPENTPA